MSCGGVSYSLVCCSVVFLLTFFFFFFRFKRFARLTQRFFGG